MINKQFGRTLTATIGQLGDSRGVKIQNLKMNFTGTKTNDRDQNTGTLRIFNLSQRDIASIVSQGKNMGVNIEAGLGNNVDYVFIGNVLHAHGEKQQTNNILTLEIIDGLVSTSQVWFAKSYAGVVDPFTILADIVAEMRLFTDLQIGEITGEKVPFYQNGFVWNGTANSALNRICTDKKLQWFIADNMINILEYETPLTNPLVPLLTADTGLIGSPQFFEDDAGDNPEKWTERGVSFSCLLNPKIKIGSEVKIESNNYNDHYLVRKISYDLDSHEGNFLMNCEAINEWV